MIGDLLLLAIVFSLAFVGGVAWNGLWRRDAPGTERADEHVRNALQLLALLEAALTRDRFLDPRDYWETQEQVTCIRTRLHRALRAPWTPPGGWFQDAGAVTPQPPAGRPRGEAPPPPSTPPAQPRSWW